MANELFKLRRFVKRYGFSILFPVIAVSSIYADYSHTQAWKAEKRGLALAAASELHMVFTVKRALAVIFPMTGYFIGKKLDDMETLRMTRFRDKSALYGRVLAPGEQPSWP